MSVDDDTAWLVALAGRSDAARAGKDAEAAVQDALMLRDLIRAQEFEVTSVPSVDPARERELIARAYAQGLLPESAAGPARRRFAGLRAAWATAAVIIVAVGIGLYRSSTAPMETLRGTENGTVHLESRDPFALKTRLTAELRAAGVQVSGYERLGRPGIDADLPQPLPIEVRQILQKHHIPVPKDGTLVVEFDEPSDR